MTITDILTYSVTVLHDMFTHLLSESITDIRLAICVTHCAVIYSVDSSVEVYKRVSEY